MFNSTFKNIVSRIKEITVRPNKSKYVKKLLIIIKKQRKKLRRGKQHSKRLESTNFRIGEYTNDKLIEECNTTTTSDSGISRDDSPENQVVTHFTTEAVIEPLPKTYQESPRISDATVHGEPKKSSTTTACLEDFPTKHFNENFTSKRCHQDTTPHTHYAKVAKKHCVQSIATKYQDEFDEYPLVPKNCNQVQDHLNLRTIDPSLKPTVYYENVQYLKNSFRPTKKWDQTYLNDRPKIITNAYHRAPVKPPRLHLKTTSPSKIDLKLDTPAKPPNFLNNLEKIVPNKDDVPVDLTVSDLSKDLEVYSEFKRGLMNNPNPPKDVNEKFVVNVYESRQSARWKQQSLNVGQADKMKILNDPPKKMIHKKTPVDQNNKSDSTKDEIYFKMKKMRDMECVKMKEASNALWMIKNSPKRNWSEELLAESILLETELRYKAILNNIRDTKDNEHVSAPIKISGGITLSNFQFNLVPQEEKKDDDTTTFFILAISNDTEIITTKAIQKFDDNKLEFNETFSLKELNENFKITAEIYSVTLHTAKRGIIQRFLKKKSKCCYPKNKIYFENVNTYEMQESAILKPSFTQCGELIITKENIGSSLFVMEKYNDEKLKSIVTATLTVDHMTSNRKFSGFLTLGKMDEDKNIHYWERKWCSLVNNTFSIYNYPQDEEFDKNPEVLINIEYCFIPIIKNPKDCPRKRTFIIKTGRPSTLNDSNCKQLRRKNNFILNKYYLSADSGSDFGKWTEQLDSAIEELDDWKRLIFKDEYYL